MIWWFILKIRSMPSLRIIRPPIFYGEGLNYLKLVLHNFALLNDTRLYEHNEPTNTRFTILCRLWRMVKELGGYYHVIIL